MGDFDSLELLEEFRKLPNFHGVSGNHDGPAIKTVLPEQDIIEIEGRRFGLVHGHGCFWPRGIRRGLVERFRGEKLDAILYGHTHWMVNNTGGGTLFFNPGSAAGRFPSTLQSYGIISVNGSLSGRHFTIDKPSIVDNPFDLAGRPAF